ncbi:holo-ACP synthase [Rhizohabitans arisaemae]|uniref:holo-ACP synthase n=1 Tax=Rhizohabitans arisaemae TaxID=2720610 RepID=UPI0024B19ABD|nr:holo-ACP synthase [Rhizohabitans arisaemae]
MILGIGVDIVDIGRFAATLERTPSLRKRLFTEGEQALAIRSLAARFAAKEAVAKALGAPPGLRHIDAEIQVGEHGKPELRVAGTVASAADERGVTRWHVSLSHDGGMAIAMVVAEG